MNVGRTESARPPLRASQEARRSLPYPLLTAIGSRAVGDNIWTVHTEYAGVGGRVEF